ncbi:MAG: galactitol-1-phosphate 5-dehydrogenase [Candidatus Atribacteria bacterium]|nr:galactitol-1-phosphate 5-dehydrogenase [Candidatus Atribacteria bacterium]
MDTMKALVLLKKGTIQLQNVPKPKPAKGEALIRVRACGICGSDIPRIYGDIAYYYPSIPGHEFAGDVEDVADLNQNGNWIGKRVTVFPLIPCYHCRLCQIGLYEMCESYGYIGSRRDGAFAEYVTVPVVNCLELPDKVSYESGALSEPAAVTLHALRRSSIPFGKTVAVFGLGPIGVLFGIWARIAGARRLIGFDIDQQKVDFARENGFDDAMIPEPEKLEKAVKNYTEAGGFDLTCEASGSNRALVHSIKITHKFGEVLLLGNQERDVTLTPQEMSLILRKQLTLHGTWNSRFTHIGSDWKAVLEFENSGQANFKPFISHRLTLKEVPEFIQLMKEKKVFYKKVLIIP